MAFVRQDGDVPPAADSVPTPSSPLMLRRGEPVSVTIVNHTRAPTGVHWHGIELPSYPGRRAGVERTGLAHGADDRAGRLVRRRVHADAKRHVHLSRAFQRDVSRSTSACTARSSSSIPRVRRDA